MNGSSVGKFNYITGAYSGKSDFRLKKNIESIVKILPKVLNLSPRCFHFIEQSDNDQKSIGFVAQEVIHLFPSLVTYSIEDDLYSLNYSGFGVLAIAAIKEQQALIEEKDQEILALKERLDKIEAMLGMSE